MPAKARAYPGLPAGLGLERGAGFPSRPVRSAAPLRRALLLDALGVDLLLAHLLGDGPLVGDGLLVEPHALLRDCALLGNDLLLVQHDLVLLLGDVGAGRGTVPIAVSDGLPLDAHFLPLHRHAPRDLLGHDILLQPGAPALTLGRANPQLFL